MKNILIKQNPKRTDQGFTIVELLIASGVFSTLLLLSLAGFLQIGRLFYKGVSATQTQAVARQVMDGLETDINFAPSTSAVVVNTDSSFSVGSTTYQRKYFCANGFRYTFIPGKVLSSDAEATMLKTVPESAWQDFGILKDKMASRNSCARPFTAPATAIDPLKAVELLSDNMRISDLSIQQPIVSVPPIYTLNVKIAYGGDTILQNPTATTASCDSSLSTSQYCFISNLWTTISGGY
jgi:prepilin-type N-terminal cleavage/methylation domain-containing protein